MYRCWFWKAIFIFYFLSVFEDTILSLALCIVCTSWEAWGVIGIEARTWPVLEASRVDCTVCCASNWTFPAMCWGDKHSLCNRERADLKTVLETVHLWPKISTFLKKKKDEKNPPWYLWTICLYLFPWRYLLQISDSIRLSWLSLVKL